MKKFSLLLGMLFFVVGAAFSQRTITGTVSDDKGETLLGASVLEKGTTNGVVTDENGKFTLTVSKDAQALLISFAGFNNQEVTLGTATDVTVSMTSSVLQEVIVTGTGVGTDRRKVAVDVQTITAKNLPAAPTASIDQALVGKVAGAQISSVNGTPGARVSILLRGINTLNRGTTPMYLIDGVEMGATDLNTLDLNSIERVEVVQGAASASLYGAQGANGIIQMFSKKGKKDQLNIDFSTSYTTSSFLNLGDVHKAVMHPFVTDVNNNVIDSKGGILAIDPTYGYYPTTIQLGPNNNLTDPKLVFDKSYGANLKYVDHFSLFLKAAPTINNSVTISGGSGKIDFLFGVSNNYQESNFVGNGNYNRTNITANIGVELAKGLRFRSVTRGAFTKSTINDAGQNSTIYALFNSRPFADYAAKLPDGHYPAYLGNAVGVNGANPFFWNEYSRTNDNYVDAIQVLNLNYQPTSWLEFDAKYGINYRNENVNNTFDRQTENANANDNSYYVGGSLNGSIYNTNVNALFQNFIPSATLKYGLGNLVKASTYGAFDYRNRTFSVYGTSGLDLPQYTPVTAAQTATQKITTDYTEPFITYGYLVDQRFDIGDFGGISGGFRSDYSSAFGAGSTPFTFPHANGYLRPSSFNFWKNSGINGIIPEIKLRAAYGKAGIQPNAFDRYQTLGYTPIGGNAGFVLPSTQANPNLQVEISTETEFGADFGFKISKGNWLNQITFSPTYWTRKTDNAIGNAKLSPSTGINSIKDNIIGLESSGFQMVTNLTVADTKDLQWDLRMNYGTQTSKVASIAGAPLIVQTAAGSTGYIIEAGSKVGQVFGYLGLHDVNATDANGKSYIAEADKANYVVASNGWVANKTTKAPYFTPDRYSFGDPNPTFIMNFINSMTFKNFLRFNFQIDWVQGSHIYNQTKEWMYRDGISSDYDKPLTIDGQTGAWSAFYRGVYAERSRNGTKSYFYEDASFVRLRNIEVSFDLAKFIDIKWAKKLELAISGRNLITLTKYTGLDPEINSSNAYTGGTGQQSTNGSGFDSAWDRGTDHNTMPNTKQYSVGLRVGF